MRGGVEMFNTYRRIYRGSEPRESIEKAFSDLNIVTEVGQAFRDNLLFFYDTHSIIYNLLPCIPHSKDKEVMMLRQTARMFVFNEINISDLELYEKLMETNQVEIVTHVTKYGVVNLHAGDGGDDPLNKVTNILYAYLSIYGFFLNNLLPLSCTAEG